MKYWRIHLKQERPMRPGESWYLDRWIGFYVIEFTQWKPYTETWAG